MAVAATWFALLSVIWKTPENVPLKGKIKPKLAPPMASLAKEVMVEHPVKACGYGQNCRNSVEFAGRLCNCELPEPLFAVVSRVIVPMTGGKFLPGESKNHVDRNASDGAGVGLGEGAGLGDGVGFGVGMGVGVGVGRILLETEPQPAASRSSPLIKNRMAVRKRPSWTCD